MRTNFTNNKFLKIIALSFFPILFLIISCNQTQSHLITNQASFRIIERQDHQNCLKKGMDFGQWGDVITEIYWRCRYNLIQERKIHDAVDVRSMRNNALVEEVSKEILSNLNRAKQAVLSNINDDVKSFDHHQCINMGYVIDHEDNKKMENYYRCREELVLERLPPAPDITHIYETAPLPRNRVDQYVRMSKEARKIDKRLMLIDKMAKRYPICKDLNINSKEFGQCVFMQKESQRCMDGIGVAKARKRLNDKIYCQEQSFVHFPENYHLTKEKSLEEIERIRKEKEYLEQDKNKKTKDKKREEKENITLKFLEGDMHSIVDIKKKKIIDEVRDDIKRKYRLYNKIELLQLREQFILRCHRRMEEDMPKFVKGKITKCKKIATHWDKDL